MSVAFQFLRIMRVLDIKNSEQKCSRKHANTKNKSNLDVSKFSDPICVEAAEKVKTGENKEKVEAPSAKRVFSKMPGNLRY